MLSLVAPFIHYKVIIWHNRISFFSCLSELYCAATVDAVGAFWQRREWTGNETIPHPVYYRGKREAGIMEPFMYVSDLSFCLLQGSGLLSQPSQSIRFQIDLNTVVVHAAQRGSFSKKMTKMLSTVVEI